MESLLSMAQQIDTIEQMDLFIHHFEDLVWNQTDWALIRKMDEVIEAKKQTLFTDEKLDEFYQHIRNHDKQISLFKNEKKKDVAFWTSNIENDYLEGTLIRCETIEYCVRDYFYEWDKDAKIKRKIYVAIQNSDESFKVNWNTSHCKVKSIGTSASKLEQKKQNLVNPIGAFFFTPKKLTREFIGLSNSSSNLKDDKESNDEKSNDEKSNDEKSNDEKSNDEDSTV